MGKKLKKKLKAGAGFRSDYGIKFILYHMNYGILANHQ
jgi:hypothetical protein